jgi:hypothetical protein
MRIVSSTDLSHKEACHPFTRAASFFGVLKRDSVRAILIDAA